MVGDGNPQKGRLRHREERADLDEARVAADDWPSGTPAGGIPGVRRRWIKGGPVWATVLG